MSTDVSGASREEVARDVLTEQFLALNDDLGNGAVRWATAIAAMLVFSDRERAPVQVDVERLREALKPFAKECATWWDQLPDDARPWIAEPGNHGGNDAEFTLGDLRRARDLYAALTPSLQAGGEGEGRDVEAAAWAWLEKRFGTASEDPVDRAYAADEMVDAFIAGRARHSLSPAPSAVSVPEGWVAVPRVPTRAMLDAGKAAGFWDDPEMTFAGNVWTAMIRAAMEEG